MEENKARIELKFKIGDQVDISGKYVDIISSVDILHEFSTKIMTKIGVINLLSGNSLLLYYNPISRVNPLYYIQYNKATTNNIPIHVSGAEVSLWRSN